MSIGKRQKEIINALINGGYVWTVGKQAYLAKVVRMDENGDPIYRSDNINHRTYTSMVESGLLVKDKVKIGLKEREVWVFGGDA